MSVVARPDCQLVDALTPRERDILPLLAEGLSDREIAEKLVISDNTVRWYNLQIYDKFGLEKPYRKRRWAVQCARQLGLLTQLEGETVIEQAGENPYKGLDAFQQEDAAFFFGREAFTEQLVQALQEKGTQRRFLAVVGPSGSGKSSIVRAGLIPALARDQIPGASRWVVMTMCPRVNPFYELESGLHGIAIKQQPNLLEMLQRDAYGLARVTPLLLPEDRPLLIIVDQFEELFTLVEEQATARRFLDLLYAAVTDPRSTVRVIITLRADFLDRPLMYPDFSWLIQEHISLVGPLTTDQMERAIVKPAKLANVSIEPAVTAKMLAEAHQQPGALPLLQFALTELYDNRVGRSITMKAYDEIGGLYRTLATQAEKIFASLDDRQQEVAQQLFLRLITLGEGTEDVRRRVPITDLVFEDVPAESLEYVIQFLAANRLLTLDLDPATKSPSVEVAHEALIREWGRLRNWLDNSRADVRMERLLNIAAGEWERHEHETSYLLRGARLTQFHAWYENSSIALTAVETQFLRASMAENRHQQQRRRMRRKVMLVAAAALALLLLILTLAANYERRRAERAAAEFRSIALSYGSTTAIDNGQPDVALALAFEAINMETPPEEAIEAFFLAASSNWMQRRFQVADAAVFDVAYHPDGKRIITSSWDGRSIVWDTVTGAVMQTLDSDSRLLQIALHPSGSRVALGGFDGLLQLWDLETNEVIERRLGDALHTAPLFTQDGSQLLSASGNGVINVWDLNPFSIVRSFEAHTSTIPSMHFNSDETLLVTASLDKTVKVWEVASSELLQQLDLDDWAWDAQWLADDEHLLIAANSAGIQLVNWKNKAVLWSVDGFTAQDVVLSPDEQTFIVVSGLPEPVAQLRDLQTGRLIRSYRGHTQRVQNVAYSPEGQHFVTASSDGTVILWPVYWEGALRTIPLYHSDAIVQHPNRPLVATMGARSATADYTDKTIWLFNTASGQLVEQIGEHRETAGTLAFTPDGRSLLSADEYGTITDYYVYQWDLLTGEQSGATTPVGDAIAAIAVSPDGQLTAVGEHDGGTRIVLVDSASGEQLSILRGHSAAVNGLVFSPDGRSLYSAGSDGKMYQWNTQAGMMTMEFDGHPQAIYSLDISSDGRRLLSASRDQTAVLWDTASGAKLMTLAAHSARVNRAEFSPDESMIMTASTDGKIMIWHAQTGQLLHILVAAEDPYHLLATYGLDNSQIISVSYDQLTIWGLSNLAGDMITWARDHRYVPEFSCELRALYVIEPLCPAMP